MATIIEVENERSVTIETCHRSCRYRQSARPIGHRAGAYLACAERSPPSHGGGEIGQATDTRGAWCVTRCADPDGSPCRQHGVLLRHRGEGPGRWVAPA